MQRISLTLLFSSLFLLVKAQNHGIVKAILLDSLTEQPIPLATVSILKLKDTSLISYTVTDKNGVFTLRNLREEPSRLLISHVGYPSLHVDIVFKKNEVTDLGKLYLAGKILQEVVIKGERVPVIIKKDTIEFNAEAFKTRPNAVVEDLLKKLPGMQVNHDGHITLNGKDISKIKVDGKDFFVNDPTIATRNLDADMIAKVQVYDDRENDPDHQQLDYAVKKIINLKFKKAMTKSNFGKVTAGVGTRDRYDANIFYGKFTGNTQIGVNANGNNLSGTGIFNEDFRMPAFFGGSSTINKTNSATVSFDRSFGKNFKFNANYEFRDNISDGRSALQRQQFIGDTTFTTNSLNLSHQRTNDQSLHIQTEWKPDTLTNIKYNPDIAYSYNNSNNSGNSISGNNFIPLLNTSTNSDHGSGHSVRFQHNFTYYRKLSKKGASLSISNAINIHPENSLNFNSNDLVSYVAALQSDTLRRSAKTTNTDNSGSISAGLHYPITKKLTANISLLGLHDRNAGDLLTYDQDLKTGLYTIYLQNQSSNLIRNQWEQDANTDLTYEFSEKISLKAGLTGRLQQIGNHFNSYTKDINQHFAYLLPSFQFHLDKVTLSYGEDIRQPAINDLQPITIVYSPLFSFTGNPDLKPTREHTLGFNYTDRRSQSQLFWNVNSRLVVETNTILRERTVTAEGAEVTSPINRNGRFTASINGYIAKNFKRQNKWQISTSTNINAIAGHNFFEVNHQDGYQNTKAIVLSQEFTANWNDVFEIRPAYNINSAITKYALVDYKNSSYTTQKALVAMDLFLPQKYSWGINYTYSYNPLVAQGFRQRANLLSLSLARRIQKKDKGELRITCYDLLDQSVNSYHYASENTINDVQNQLLRRYFLFTYTYRFNGFNRR